MRSGARQACPLLPLLLLNIVLEVLAMVIRKEYEIKEIHIGKEDVKLSLFANDIILYIENLKEITRKLLELINEFSKVEGYILWANNERSEREIKERIPFTIASKIIKYLGINLPKVGR